MEKLKYAKMYMPFMEVIILTAFGSIESVIESMKYGAFDYIIKPLDPKELKEKIERILEYRSLSVPKTPFPYTGFCTTPF